MAEVKGSPEAEIQMPREGVFRSCVWSEMKDEIGPQLTVTLLFFAKLLIAAIKDERFHQPPVFNAEISKSAKVRQKDEMERIQGSG